MTKGLNIKAHRHVTDAVVMINNGAVFRQLYFNSLVNGSSRRQSHRRYNSHLLLFAEEKCTLILSVFYLYKRQSQISVSLRINECMSF